MRKIIFVFFLFSSTFSQGQNIDVLHYKFSLLLKNTSDTIYGHANIKFIKRSDALTIQLDLASKRSDGKGMYVATANTDLDNRSSMSWRHTEDKLIINASKLKKGDTGVANIMYHGIPSDGLIITQNKYGDRTFFADNWPNRAHHWIPCNDRPDDKASFEFSVVAPEEYRVISNGILKSEITFERSKETHWIEATPLPTKVMVIGVARFATKTFTDSPQNIPVSAWVYPQDSTKGFYDYGLAPDIVKFFSSYIAPFPYKKLANVQSRTIFGGMENASAIFYAENSVTGDRSKEDLLVHEIAHQWFGDMASEKSFAHLWLSEGFATYFTNYYWEEKYGKEAAAERWKADCKEVIAFSKRSSIPVVDSTKDLMSLLNANSYQKGAWVLRMLRNEFGDTVFQKIIQTYYQQYKGSNAETRDFKAVAEKVSGKELTWFFDQWLYQAGVPTLHISWEYKNGSVYILPYGADRKFFYQLPTELLFIYKDGKSEKYKVTLEPYGHTQIKILSKNKPLKISLDPDYNLLFEGKISEKNKSR